MHRGVVPVAPAPGAGQARQVGGPSKGGLDEADLAGAVRLHGAGRVDDVFGHLGPQYVAVLHDARLAEAGGVEGDGVDPLAVDPRPSASVERRPHVLSRAPVGHHHAAVAQAPCRRQRRAHLAGAVDAVGDAADLGAVVRGVGRIVGAVGAHREVVDHRWVGVQQLLDVDHLFAGDGLVEREACVDVQVACWQHKPGVHLVQPPVRRAAGRGVGGGGKGGEWGA